MFFAYVHHEEGIWRVFQVLDAAQHALQLHHLLAQLDDFLFRQTLEGAVLFHGAQFAHAVDALLDGLEVGHHAAQPAIGHEVHAAALRSFIHGVLGLLFRADEKNLPAVGGDVAQEGMSFFQAAQRLVQVNDVDAVARAIDEALHLRVPAVGLVAEMDAGLQQLFHGYQ
ncbi:MAG: hypothetical protein BWY76_01351 [bacterium ADurb.Bin429]|nr:MAG: hypothetical protein BWY76_01351 [bacterium ADurb.Bin429]